MSDEQAANVQLRNKLMGFIVSQSICAVSELGVPDYLAAGPLPLEDIASAVDANPDALARFLRALVAEGLFTEDTPGIFGLGELGMLLRSDTPGSLRHFATLMTGEAYTAWGAASRALYNGKPTFDHVFGSTYFEWLAENPDAADRFDRAQAGLVELRLLPLFERDWLRANTVVDIGGGNGFLMASLLQRHAHLSGIVFDLPHVVFKSSDVLAEAGVSGRAHQVAGDFFEKVPSGADVYVLSQILHDWDDDQATVILENCRRALADDGRVVILEQVLPSVRERTPARLLDLHMLVLLGGRERTAEDWEKLLARSGLGLSRIRQGSRSALIEAQPA